MIEGVLSESAHSFKTKEASVEAALVLVDIYRLTMSRKAHGCSLKIHRVELALSEETAHS
jgi:hypothetical protein